MCKAIGQHRLRAVTDGLAWEATFTFPDRTWIKAARRVRFDVELHFQEINGAESYQVRFGERPAVPAMASPVRLANAPQEETNIFLSARFGELPFVCHTTALLRAP